MHNSVVLDKALCFSSIDIHSLAKGQSVGLISERSLAKGARFALCSSAATCLDLDIEQCYKPQFWSTANTSLSKQGEVNCSIQYWAECQGCRIIDSREDLNKITSFGIWRSEFLETWLDHRQFIILAFLRAYRLPEPIPETTAAKVGKFVGLAHPIHVQKRLPILEDAVFLRRLEQTKAFESPTHPQLETLEAALANSVISEQPAAQRILADLKPVLDWSLQPYNPPDDDGIAWMTQIAALGERSKELDKGKSNYQAGTDFEIAVRDSLEFLGFKIDYAHRGGAGGLDISCSEPYLLIGECKSGKKIPNDTAVQLLNLGTLRLENKAAFNRAIKIIIGPGKPTPQLEQAAIEHGMSILNPHTLEKLVQLQHQHPGSIDLIELKKYLTDGRADDDVCQYIDEIKNNLRLRASIVEQVKTYLLNAKSETANLDALHAVYMVSDPPQRLNRDEFRNILIELASPLAGYLGRRNDTESKSECFYYLRSLVV